jgi:hypothetical protein
MGRAAGQRGRRRRGGLNACDPIHRKVRDGWHPIGFGVGGGQTKASARARCGMGDGGGGEADFSAAPLTKNVIGFGRNDGFSFVSR